MEKIKETVDKIGLLKKEFMLKAQERLDRLTKPKGSLGMLEDLAAKIVAITENMTPKFEKKAVVVMAGDHGVADEGVSAYPKEVTVQMVYNFLRGGAAINVLSKIVNAKVIVVDMGVAGEIEEHPQLISKKIGYGTNSIFRGAAMSRKDAIDAIQSGIEIFETEYTSNGIDLLVPGDMGIGNTTPSSAIIACLTEHKPVDVVGRGTGIDDAKLSHKIKVIEKSIKINKPDNSDPIDVLAKVGGYEIGGIAGLILAAASYRIPVVIDGLISTAGALIAYGLSNKVNQYIFAGHSSAEIGHKVALNKLGIKPILDLDMRLGEGTGAVLSINILEAAIRLFNEMATFEEAGVSEKD